MRIVSALSLILFMASCGDFYGYYYPSVYPPNYRAFDVDTVLNGDEVDFYGQFNPSGTPNGTSTNAVQAFAINSAAPANPLPSSLVGTSWIGRSNDVLAPQITLTFNSSTEMTIQLDCFFSSTNILLSNNAITQPVTLSDKTIYFDNVFRIRNMSNTDVFTRCYLLLDTYGLVFSSAMTTAQVSTVGGIVLGVFTQL